MSSAGVTAGVEIRGPPKRYGDTIALDGLDLDARPGEILGIAGPNGAGKSTMVKILAAEVAGDDGRHPDRRRAVVGVARPTTASPSCTRSRSSSPT